MGVRVNDGRGMTAGARAIARLIAAGAAAPLASLNDLVALIGGVSLRPFDGLTPRNGWIAEHRGVTRHAETMEDAVALVACAVLLDGEGVSE